MIRTMNGQVDGLPIAKYRKGKFTLTCKISNGLYCATFHNGRYTNRTAYINDKDEMNQYVAKNFLADGFVKEA